MAKTDKTDKKIKKIDKKTGRKCGALIAFLALSAMLCGCLHPEGQPSRSQTQNNDFNHCIVIVADISKHQPRPFDDAERVGADLIRHGKLTLGFLDGRRPRGGNSRRVVIERAVIRRRKGNQRL